MVGNKYSFNLKNVPAGTYFVAVEVFDGMNGTGNSILAPNNAAVTFTSPETGSKVGISSQSIIVSNTNAVTFSPSSLTNNVQVALNFLPNAFIVNTYTTNRQINPSIASDSAGDFVVTWQSDQQEGGGYSSRYGIYAQRYNSAGVAQGSEFQVNTYTTNQQKNPAIAMDSAGDFVVSWQSGSYYGIGQDGSSYGVFGKLYNSTGLAK